MGTRTDHRAALKAIEALMAAKPSTPDGERLDVLVTLVEAYECKHFPLDLPGDRTPAWASPPNR